MQSSSAPSGKLVGLLAFVILLILYGSLYPWEFEPLRDADPLTVLLHSWDLELNRFIIRDIGVNIILYMPLGFTAYLVFRRARRSAMAIIGSGLLGCILSCLVEMAQAFEPDRHTSLVDVTTNVIGSVAGAFAAMIAEEITGGTITGAFGGRRSRKSRDSSALALLGIFLASLLFPLFPISGRTALVAKIASILHGPVVEPVTLLSALSSWYAAGLMMRAAGFRASRWYIAFLLAPLAAQLFVIHHNPWIATVLGATLGAVAAYLLPPKPRWGAVVLIGMIVARGLQPFLFVRSPQPFLWIPFGGFLAMDWATGVVLIFQKAFYYGAAIWLLRAAGMQVRIAIAAVAALLAALEALQIFIPAHTAEITDPLLALLLGFGIAALSPSRGKETRFRSQE